MTTQPIAPPPVATGAQLPTQQANSFALALNANEILLSIGESRIAIVPGAAGPTPQHSVEWVVTLSISPVAASQLIQILQAGVKTYEAQFGKIATDPAFKMTGIG